MADEQNQYSNQGIGFLPRLAINRPISVLMSLLALLVVGYIAYSQISVDLFPSGFSPPFLGVWVPYPNANPEEVEQFIARPIEEVIRTIKGVKTVSTNSFTNGCWTRIEFAQETDMDVAYGMLRDRMDRIKPELPDDIERLHVRKWSDDDEPVLWVTIVPDKKLDDPYYFTEQYIKKPLEKIDGVANIEIWGADEKQILIYINQHRVKSYKINLYEVIEGLRNDNFAISSGNLRSGGQKIYVRSVGKFKTMEEIRNLPIKGTNIYLKDIADITYDVPERTWVQRIDGKPSIQIGVFKESLANTVDICRQLQNKFDVDFKNDQRFAGFRIETLFNQGHFIEESIENLKDSALWGGFFSFLVIYFFLRRIRMTMILNIAIPLSLLICMTAMYFIGWTLNIITMMGLMISVGMVVDNSIVVLENIYHKRALGYSNRRAAGVGASEVGLAITMSTFTTIVVFLPLILMNDDIGFRFYMLRIGLPVMISLVASLIVAMVFIPMAAHRIVSRREIQEPAVIVKTKKLYRTMMVWVLNHRIESFIILILLMTSTFMVMDKIGRTDDMQGNINDFRLFMDLPDNYSLQDAGKLVAQIEDTIRVKADLYNIRTIDVRYRNNFARLQVFLQPQKPEQWYIAIYNEAVKMLGIKFGKFMDRDLVVEDVKKRLPVVPGVTFRTSWQQQGGQNDASMTLSLYGDDTNKLAELSREVERRLRKIPEILSVETDRESGEDEIRLVLKREQVQKYGINPRVISGTVMYALRGIQLPKYQTEEKEIDIVIQLRKEDRQNLQQLKNITFFTRSGREIPLAAVADLQVVKGFGEIHRENGKTYLGVKANSTSENIGAVYTKVDLAMKGFEMPYGYSWTKGDRFQRMNEGDDSMIFGVYLAITFVFLLMGVLFESFVLPLSVIISIPFSFVGAFWILYITGTPMDMMSQIGIIILIGIVVNNAIVLVDLVNRLRNEGYSRFDALIEAGQNRLRPILMTALTTIGGLIPMAIGNAKMIGIPYAPMGRTIIGGLAFSTLVSLCAVPWAYTIFDDMRNYFKGVVGGVIMKSKARQDMEMEPAAKG
jgi:HAE1 family hydrophobic/amphiphilic exporter-1